MAIKPRDQSIFDAVYSLSESLGYTTFDFKPASDERYPFVELEDTQVVHEPNKTDIKGPVILNLSVWGLKEQRGLISHMASAILNAARLIEATDGYRWSFNYQASGIRILDDTSTGTTLKRALVTLEFRLN